MRYLLFPPKTPQYRAKRDHEQFLCRLNEYFVDKTVLQDKIVFQLEQHFHVKNVIRETVRKYLEKPHRKATQLLEDEL